MLRDTAYNRMRNEKEILQSTVQRQEEVVFLVIVLRFSSFHPFLPFTEPFFIGFTFSGAFFVFSGVPRSRFLKSTNRNLDKSLKTFFHLPSSLEIAPLRCLCYYLIESLIFGPRIIFIFYCVPELSSQTWN